jgi:DNA-binding NarL/FixJ family response regulator
MGEPAKVALAISDEAVKIALREALLMRPGLVESDEADAAVVIAEESPIAADFALSRQMLLVGAARAAGQTSIDSVDPQLVLSAAELLAAGYRITSEPAPHDVARLSVRETEVAGLLVDGASNKVVARTLGISVHTVKFHVTAVLDKLGARNRADAVAIALREGLVTL